ncbi:MAG TPA: hypothetical protein VKC35_03545 [Vicinamibacterales bacterium]|nr:hypothetical protein [Vicinamibacterales bacterium]
MSAVIRIVALAGVIGTVACGATTSGTSGSTSAPVYVPPTSNAPSTTANTTPSEVNSSAYGVVPAGQELDVRLGTTLSSKTAKVEQRFQTTTVADLMQNGNVLIPAGSTVRGVVSAVDPADRLHRAGSLTLSFDELTVRGRSYATRAMATNVFESGGIREEAGTAGIGAGAGAVVGGILGGLKGAILGAVIGAGGAIAATEGKDIDLPAGSIVRIRLDQPVTVR